MAPTMPPMASGEIESADVEEGAGVVLLLGRRVGGGVGATPPLAEVVVAAGVAEGGGPPFLSGPIQPPEHSWSCRPLMLVQNSRMGLYASGHVHVAQLAGPGENVVPSQGATMYWLTPLHLRLQLPQRCGLSEKERASPLHPCTTYRPAGQSCLHGEQVLSPVASTPVHPEA